jgi:hypothetical protein
LACRIPLEFARSRRRHKRNVRVAVSTLFAYIRYDAFFAGSVCRALIASRHVTATLRGMAAPGGFGLSIVNEYGPRLAGIGPAASANVLEAGSSATQLLADGRRCREFVEEVTAVARGAHAAARARGTVRTRGFVLAAVFRRRGRGRFTAAHPGMIQKKNTYKICM